MRVSSLCAAVVSAAIALPGGTTPSEAGTLFAALAGSWSGGGTVRLANGKKEELKCRAYYTKKGGSGLGVAIRCASPSNKFNLRSSLRQGGTSVTGTWEERTLNAEGSVSGTVSETSLRVTFQGTVSGSLSISLNGNRNTVYMSTGEGGVSLSFRRL